MSLSRVRIFEIGVTWTRVRAKPLSKVDIANRGPVVDEAVACLSPRTTAHHVGDELVSSLRRASRPRSVIHGVGYEDEPVVKCASLTTAAHDYWTTATPLFPGFSGVATRWCRPPRVVINKGDKTDPDGPGGTGFRNPIVDRV